ncbi:zinc ribbon domain-containing protein [Metabacillus sp. HB246100]|uniref:zinc ribbon domain-containing protein n=1 Tax=Bacillus weihaiensis TaxID=1547283 RepID=UPI0023537B0E|nr:FxLYD domain-containing protein [Bacillus weihaiensis]
MFCPNCGEGNIDKRANYCPICGKKLFFDQIKRKKLTIISIIMPVISLTIVITALITVYHIESNVNKKVLNYQNLAERAALSGEYEEALDLIKKGLSYRENYETLKNEEKLVEAVIELNEDLSNVEKNIMNEQFVDAKKKITTLKKQVDKNESPLFVKLTYEIEKAESSVKIGELKEEITELSTIDELAKKLSTLYSLELQEASELKQQIYTKMIMISSAEAESSLEKKHFSQALFEVDTALQYVVNNDKLLSLKDRIISEKLSFEEAEQERISKAIIAAEEEQQHNLTKAVGLVDVQLKVDKFGDAYIDGSVINSGTEGVHSIIVEFDVKNNEGKLIEAGKTNVFPNKLDPGESGNFEHVTYSTKKDAKIEIKKISWLLEEKKG